MIFQIFQIFSWSFMTHSFLGDTLINYISLEKRNKLCQEFNSCDFSKASLFADKIKFVGKYKYTRNYHYIDISLKQKEPLDNFSIDFWCNDDCILNGLKMNGTREKIFILHFIQDILQPFHNLKEYRGGNDVYLRDIDSGKDVSVHYFWDNYLPERFIRESVSGSSGNQIQFEISESEDEAEYSVIKNSFKIAKKEFLYYKSQNFEISFEKYYNTKAKWILKDLFFNKYPKLIEKFL